MTERPGPRRKVPVETIVEMGRLKGLSDGVVAFALTLLVLDIRLPSDVDGGNLLVALRDLAPVFAVYLLSFVVIGGAWGAHQRMLSQISRGDGLMVWWTLLSLLPITLLPASADLLGDHPGEPLAIAVFAIDVITIEATAWLLWRHASRQGLIDSDIDQRVVASIGRRHVFAALLFLVSIPFALVFVPIVYAIWVATFALVFTTDWLSWRSAQQATTESIPAEGAERARVRIEHGSGKLVVQSAAVPSMLVEGSFGGGVTSRVTRDGARADVRLTLPGRSMLLHPRYPWAWGLANLLDWTVGLTPALPIELTVEMAKGEATLLLDGLQLAALTFRASGSAATISFPAVVGLVEVEVDASSAPITLRIPDGVAASIKVQKFRSALEIDKRFPMMTDGRHYESAGYTTAENRLQIQVNLALGTLRVEGPPRASASGDLAAG